MRKLNLLFAFLITCTLTAQQGGMWIPSLLKGMNEQEMTSLGSKLTADDIYNVNKSSLKDAIGHFNGGCTSEVISKKGLILTNHHCGFGQIQSHSTLENDYLKDGFWAKDFKDELPNEDLYVEFIVRIDDVTMQALQGVTDAMDARTRQSTIDKNINQIQKNVQKEDWQLTKVRPFYKGNQYFLFVTEKFEDVRLVGAPPTSIGKFGSDTDNWVFPRHTGDFSLFRIYADKNNRPAKYSKDNKPYKPKHYLPISIDGVQEDDFTMVFGFPGRTNEYLPAVAIEHITEEFNPTNIAIREAALKVIDANMKANDAVRIKYASKQARIANAWKKWIGENLGIKKSNAIEKRKAFEAKFTEAIDKKGLPADYKNILPEFDKLYKDFAPINIKRRNFIEVFIVTNELMQMTYRAYQFEQAVKSDASKLEAAKASLVGRLKGIHKNYDVNVDKGVYEAVMPLYSKNVDASIYNHTAFTNLDSALALLEGSADEAVAKLNNDKAYTYAKPFIEEFYTSINKEYQEKNEPILALQKKYMKAQMEAVPDARYFPDANSTLRVTYGKVKGYSPRDAVYYNHVSYLDGVVEKYVPGDYEFDVPKKLLDLYYAQDFGEYADSNGKMPVCFLGTNHTTGGNSGSPAIDAHGNLIGLNFDRVWEGTMSDMNYDPAICRNIMVDIRYVLFITDKYAGAKRLIKEMKLVHPKK
ncbi:S46 family peptidase [Tenacibaculum sp. IB213877]|uniref:S46 family peptidase n=1 Tax=Tenacibaculum sp. IB213877 TaxID=3097351 RepID=UPI002A5AF27B|nr:S46 family peptidase [Tenacibaculum sp. IB213877]MDY0779434.1 S46 family peptidase [Tenacibaculum sp. IB213877]